MATQEEWEFRIAKLVLEPGDVLVVSFGPQMTFAGLHHMRDWLGKILPAGVKSIFKEHSVDLTVLTRSQIEAATEPGAFVHRRNDMTGVRGFSASQVIIDDPHKPR